MFIWYKWDHGDKEKEKCVFLCHVPHWGQTGKFILQPWAVSECLSQMGSISVTWEFVNKVNSWSLPHTF